MKYLYLKLSKERQISTCKTTDEERGSYIILVLVAKYSLCFHFNYSAVIMHMYIDFLFINLCYILKIFFIRSFLCYLLIQYYFTCISL